MDLTYLLWPFSPSSTRKENGAVGQGDGHLSCLTHRDSEGFHSHSLESLFQQSHTGLLMGRGCLLRDHQALFILSGALPTRRGCEGQSAKGRLSPGELKL